MALFASTRVIPFFLLLGGAGPLLFALFVQYVLKLPPCHYCILQRYPYALPLLAGLLAFLPVLRAYRRALLLIGILGWLVTAGIALRHVGIEQGIIIEQGGCSAAALSGSLDDIRSQIVQAPLVACNAIAASFLGISMAAWNAVGALGLCVAALYIRRKTKADI